MLSILEIFCPNLVKIMKGRVQTGGLNPLFVRAVRERASTGMLGLTTIQELTWKEWKRVEAMNDTEARIWLRELNKISVNQTVARK